MTGTTAGNPLDRHGDQTPHRPPARRALRQPTSRRELRRIRTRIGSLQHLATADRSGAASARDSGHAIPPAIDARHRCAGAFDSPEGFAFTSR